MTYYGVRLQAKANVLFSPFGTMELKAYAAAQPFGSRIGPQLTDDDYLIKDTKPTLKINNDSTGFHINNALPNLAMRKDDGGAGKGSGFNTDGVLGTLFEGFKDADGKLESVDLAAIVKATHLAMVPNPYEGNKYNIMSDPGTDSFVQNFDNTGVGAFWAPVFPPGKGDNSAEIISIVEGLIGEAGPDSDKFKAGVIKNLNEYLAQLKQGQGEAVNPAAAQSVGEGFNIVRLQDPLRPLGLRKDTPPLSLGNGLSSTDPKEIKTSWNGVLNGAFRAEGRIGYSVKFVSFESLSTKKQKTNDATTWSNDLDADDEFQQDLQFIRH